MAKIETDPIEVQMAIKGINYPANRDDLVEQAKKNHARTHLVEKFADLKSGEYNGPTEVEMEMFA